MKALTQEEFIKRAKEIHKNEYDYSLSKFKNIRTKVSIKCNRCGYIFLQTPMAHIYKNKYGKFQGCPECSKSKQQISNILENKKAKNDFIKKAQKIHNNKYDYSLVNYKKNDLKIKIICPIHGVFEQLPMDHLDSSGCPKCIKNKAEEKISDWLDNNGYSNNYKRWYKFNNLKDKNLLSYDFFIPSKNLLIESNGKQHYEFYPRFHKTLHDFHKQKHHDWLKRKYAKDNNIRLLIIPYWEFKNIEKILKEVI